MLPLEYVVETDVVGVLTLDEVEVDALVDTDVEVLVLALEYVENTVVVGVLTLVGVDFDVDVLVLRDFDKLVDVEDTEVDTEVE